MDEPPFPIRALRRLAHGAVRRLHAVRRRWWSRTRPRTAGVHAVPLTPDGQIVLVRLSYAPGWRLPGGGRKRGEEPEAAIRRELREEIGLLRCARLERVGGFRHRPDFRDDRSDLFVARGVEYRFRWSLEVAEARAFAPDALPAELPPITRRLLRLAEGALRGG
ncbi:MAG: Trehalose-6-phosphate phosphatase [uncultured Sphingomonadaceae bacterium]|uniref:Trehalose-6-phosphate phosphatase n=1 Tax=uncultured Sphingomonadaceae bacterium TaxID=169976 RepID=A0A6J4T627_9SPHN|nr:MAG: Trehalose-6-phosphate phosphatase [uncultured Sphingomonadaceae bacterium]